LLTDGMYRSGSAAAVPQSARPAPMIVLAKPALVAVMPPSMSRRAGFS
jgi:hypothetical protein